jgi:2-amino-4-hydroxy-6-hydroxymethyldihydropteridine diphosphokinase
MSLVTVSIGSNIDPEHNIRRAIEELRVVFGELELSPVYQTEAVGFDGDDFLNLVVSFKTDKPVQTVAHELKSIEDQIGRDRSQARFSARLIDLDLLTCDDLVMDEPGIQIPRHEILQNAFVLKPLSDIFAQGVHPVNRQTYANLWREMQQHAARIDLYELELPQ